MKENQSANSFLRPRLIAARWISVLTCGVLAGAIYWVSYPFLSRITQPLVDRFAVIPEAVLYGVVTLLILAACWLVGQGRWRGFLGIRFLLTYPPLWVAVAAALITRFALETWPETWVATRGLAGPVAAVFQELPLATRWGLLFALGALFVAQFRPEHAAIVHHLRKGRSSKSDGSKVSISVNIGTLRSWVRDDSELSSPSNDLFNRDEIAQRIAQRLAQKEEAPTIAVIGDLGSGKSTIRRFVAHHLREHPKIRLVDISLWPYDSSESAVRGILQSIIRELGRHVNVLPLTGISEEYVAAIEKSAGRWGSLASMLSGPSDPQQIILRISNIANAAGLKLVLWIEDAERFSGGDQLAPDARNEREVERLGPIRALLHLLDRCPNISVIVSDTSLRTRFDIGKIARFVELLPPIDVEDVWRVIKLVRDRCLHDYPHRVIDPHNPESRRAFQLEEKIHKAVRFFDQFNESNQNLLDATASIIKTPRTFKSALRSTLEAWDKLAGEIDFDSLLVGSVLKIARPKLFVLVNDHIEVFRYGFFDPIRLRRRDKEPHHAAKSVNDLLAQEDKVSARSISSLLEFLFPAYPPSNSVDIDSEALKRPQALFVNRHADYWQRYLAQVCVSAADSDQQALQSIAAWRQDEPSDLIQRIIDPMRSGQIESFVRSFEPRDLTRLLREVASRLKGASPAKWERRTDAPGIISVWRMMRKHPSNGDDIFSTVSSIIKDTVPYNLTLAHHVLHYFAESSDRVPPMMAEAREQEVQAIFRTTFLSSFLGKDAWKKLLLAVEGGTPWLLSWVCWGLPRIPGGDTKGIPFDQWKEFSNVMLELARQKPTVGVPLLVLFVTKEEKVPADHIDEHNERHYGWAYQCEFVEESARRLFDFDMLVEVLADFEMPDEPDEQIRDHLHAAVDAARKIREECNLSNERRSNNSMLKQIAVEEEA